MSGKSDISKGELKKFAATFAIVFLVFAAIGYFRATRVGWIFLVAAIFLIAMRQFAPEALRPVHAGWMKFASALGWLNTRVVLGLLFIVVFSPAGIVLRILRKDLLGLRVDRSASSYWVVREKRERDRRRSERLF